MSINDLLDADLTPVIIILAIVFLFILIFAIPAGRNAAKTTNNNIYGDDEIGITNVEKKVKIIAKRTTPHPLNRTITIYMIVFELANGSRVELAIKDSNTYGTMLEGDCGTLKYYGKKFISFERERNNEA